MTTYREKKQKLKQLVRREESERLQRIQAEGHPFVDTDAFKRVQKHYKYYANRVTDFSKLLNLQDLPMAQVDGKKIYSLPIAEGAYVIKEFCEEEEQIQIGCEALNEFICRPYRTNLDGTNGLYKEIQQHGQERVATEEVRDEKGSTLYYFNEKIRMANLGYQYDWPHRCYPSTKVPIPSSVEALTQRAIRIFEKLKGEPCQYRGEAVIVNYYKQKDYMTGHLDDGEIDQVNPILSFSFGLSCVFLLGSPLRNTQPVGVQLDSGDLLIMSGPSRTCYHGVPRIIEGTYAGPEDQILQKLERERKERVEEFKALNGVEEVVNYLRRHRLNVNVRQVYPGEAGSLDIM